MGTEVEIVDDGVPMTAEEAADHRDKQGLTRHSSGVQPYEGMTAHADTTRRHSIEVDAHGHVTRHAPTSATSADVSESINKGAIRGPRP